MARSAKTDGDKSATPADDAVLSEVTSLSDSPEMGISSAESLPGAEIRSDESQIVEAAEQRVASEPALIIDEPEVKVETIAVGPEPVAEATEAATLRPQPPRAAEPESNGRGGFFPVLIGGVIAAGLGYLAAWQGLVPGRTAVPEVPAVTAGDLAAQATRIDSVEAAIAALPAAAPEQSPAPDLAPLEADITGLKAGMTPLQDNLAALDDRLGNMVAQIRDLDTRLVALQGRLAVIERAPTEAGTLAETAIAEWEAEIQALRDQIAAQDTRLLTISDEAAAKLEAAQTSVAEIEASAQASASAELRRAALTRIQAALDAGTPFEDAIADLSGAGVTIPDTLTAVAADGVSTMANLTETFPTTARAAMATARAEGLADDGEWRIMAFLRSQLDVRSVTPREGDDPDAILSRAEGSLGERRLSDALAEIGALPEVVRAEMSSWIESAEGRVAALAALQTLSESLPLSSN
jgi:hypothetical protein